MEYPEATPDNYNKAFVFYGDMMFSRQCPKCGAFMKFPKKMAIDGKWAKCKKHGKQVAYFCEFVESSQ